MCLVDVVLCFFFFKQKTAYEMRISDWSSDVCSSDLEAEKTQQGVAGKRQWLVNDLGAKRDLLKAGLGWGHLPRHLVAEDLAGGHLVELERRAWHIRSLTFVVSQRRGYDLSPCESRLVAVLGKT